MVNILHAADFHLDSPFENLTPDKARQRRSEQRESLYKLRDLARAENTDVVLLAGDLFDSDNAFHETTQILEEVFAEMEARIFISPGNHDYYSPRSPYRAVRWPENVHVFKSPVIESVELPELNCRVYGAGFNSPSCDRIILRDFTAEQDGKINIMVLHGDTAAVTEAYNPVYINDIENSKLDYLALGHTHGFTGILKAGGTAYAYPGCTEGRGFDELGEKGVIAGSVGRGKRILRFEPLGGRRYGEITLDYESLLSGSAAGIPKGAERDIYKVTLTGERDGKADLEATEEKLAGKFWHVSLRDRTKERRDIWASAREDSLKGMFIRSLRENYELGDEEQKKAIELAARYGLAAMENGEVSL